MHDCISHSLIYVGGLMGFQPTEVWTTLWPANILIYEIQYRCSHFQSRIYFYIYFSCEHTILRWGCLVSNNLDLNVSSTSSLCNSGAGSYTKMNISWTSFGDHVWYLTYLPLCTSMASITTMPTHLRRLALALRCMSLPTIGRHLRLTPRPDSTLGTRGNITNVMRSG